MNDNQTKNIRSCSSLPSYDISMAPEGQRTLDIPHPSLQFPAFCGTKQFPTSPPLPSSNHHTGSVTAGFRDEQRSSWLIERPRRVSMQRWRMQERIPTSSHRPSATYTLKSELPI